MQKYGLIGYPLGHSFSKNYFNQKFESEKIDATYLNETHRKALILGTGGASKAVFHGLKQLGVGATLVSRKPKDHCITYEEITPKTMEQYTVIVNTTPLGMYPNINACPDIPYDLLTPDHLLYDLLYNPDGTLFMKKGKEKGAIVKNGLEMLLLQAFAAWEIWQK